MDNIVVTALRDARRNNPNPNLNSSSIPRQTSPSFQMKKKITHHYRLEVGHDRHSNKFDTENTTSGITKIQIAKNNIH